MTFSADRELAARLEGLCAAELRRFVEAADALDPEAGAECLEVGGGVAAFVSAESLANQACGLGFTGPVGDDEVGSIGRFYLERGVRPLMGVSPLAHPTLVAALGARGWVVDAFENVFVREYGREAILEAAGVEIREMLDDEGRELWKLVAATGFSAPLPPAATQLALAHIVVRRPGTRLFVAFVDGMAAGTGELYCDDGVAWLSGDATLPQFRRRGVQSALQAHRLALGAEQGCELAATEALPGGLSQRNIERLGFGLAYTRVDFALEQGERCSGG